MCCEFCLNQSRAWEDAYVAHLVKEEMRVSKNKTYLKFDDYHVWDDTYESSSIMGYYTVIIPRKLMEEKVGQNVTIIQNILSTILPETLLEFKANDTEIEAYCFWEEGPCVDSLASIEIVKNAIEDDVKKQLGKLNIDEYTLILDICNG